jgi:hypothetical protein
MENLKINRAAYVSILFTDLKRKITMRCKKIAYTHAIHQAQHILQAMHL